LQGIFLGLASSLGDKVGSLVDTSNHLVLVFEFREFRGDDAEDDVLVLGQVGKRLETASARSVVFEIVCVYIKVLVSKSVSISS
jgi:hypothetical protein